MQLYRVTSGDDTDYMEYSELVIRAESAERAVEIACMATVTTQTDKLTGETSEKVEHDYPGFKLENTSAEPISEDGPEEVLFESGAFCDCY